MKIIVSGTTMTSATEPLGKAVTLVEGGVICRLGDIVFCGGYGRGLNIAIQVDECPFREGHLFINASNEMIKKCKNGVARTFKLRRTVNEDFSYIFPNGKGKRVDAETVELLQSLWDQYQNHQKNGHHV